jgi:hypothetical protein
LIEFLSILICAQCFPKYHDWCLNIIENLFNLNVSHTLRRFPLRSIKWWKPDLDSYQLWSIHLNVAGELIATTYWTLTYVPNTKFSFFNDWPRDSRCYIFLDLSSHLFKHFIRQLRRWSNHGNQSANAVFEPLLWKFKDEFNEMLIVLDFQKCQQCWLKEKVCIQIFFSLFSPSYSVY